MPYIISIDPQVKKCGIVQAVCWAGGITAIEPEMIDTAKLLVVPGSIGVTNDQNRIAIIEQPYVHPAHMRGQINFIMTVGRIIQVMSSLGFEIVMAPAWGNDGWIQSMYPRMKGDQVKKLYTMEARSLYPELKWTTDTAAALGMLRWWLLKQKREVE